MTLQTPKLKVSDIAPTTLRLPPDVRSTLMREASINGRSLSQEITRRLISSLQDPGRGGDLRVVRTGESPPMGSPVPPLGDTQRLLLTYFNALPPDKQLALLTVLRR